MKVTDLIRKRRSVRSFDGKPVSDHDAERIMEFARKVENPYDLAIEWKLLDAKRDGLSSPVITGTNTWIAGKMLQVPHREEAFGYTFEKIVLYAMSLGIGTTWIAGTMDRSAFERTMNVREGEVMPCVSPLGYPASKMSFRETMMRKGVKADSRLPFEKLFFDGSLDRPFNEETAGKLKDILEAVRLGPSAVNRQPWLIVIKDNKAHFYKKAGKGMEGANWDVQKIDIGIAMYHFEMAAAECGIRVSFMLDDPKLMNEDGLSYIASFSFEA